MTLFDNQNIGLFENNGANYATYRPVYPQELATALSQLCQNHQTALDVGCGTGQLTYLLSKHFVSVIGTDTSRSQLEFAQTAENIRYLHESAEDTRLENDSVDLVVVAQAAHWFNLDSFYQEVKRIAVQDAVIALISYGVPYIEASVNSVFQQGYWQQIHQYWPDERKHVENGYIELPFPFQEIDFPETFIHKEMNLDEFIGYIRTWSAYKKAQERQEVTAFTLFFEQLERSWGNRAKTHKVSWPISVRAGKIA
ncbi:class I SAM-dependent methyltransferase [Thiomicrorhabdus sp. 6S2-11]|uniref:Class I SAM-dependent methyltransferase n=1 Tax=Thiomicrorhabdus marina TaxID=2818442 RepID=A0ABS3Q2C4_9GAMM|nr:class I SAM-dependent methyltransferase [Thiomicrorhabdus marina]MBO1926486.1 class I SAM-dependent methyltransferase [Thiomicrorhabdus marina]